MKKHVLAGTLMVVATLHAGTRAVQEPQEPTSFGGGYAGLSPEQKTLVGDWFRRFQEVTGQELEPGAFYDDFLKLSTKTTFDAVTHALGRTSLTDSEGKPLGTALDLVQSVEAVRGKLKDSPGDRQFRMYVVLKPGAVETLQKSNEFKRGADNTIFHQGYPVNYRQQGGVPSIQISLAPDGKSGDVDVDYRSSKFPGALFNGHLSAANSDVRAGDNYDRHSARWEGFANWWRGFFGVRLTSDYEDVVTDDRLQFPERPRAGDQTIEKMVHDFLSAWLVEGNVMEAMGYISERAYPCVALHRGEPGEFDRGMAPFILLTQMKAAKDALGNQDGLVGLTVGMRLTDPALKLVDQPYHAQFVIYSMPDSLARSFDCAARMAVGAETKSRGRGEYGDYFGTTFFLDGPQGAGQTIALLWARENDYWKIVSFESEPETEEAVPGPPETPEVTIMRIDADEAFARGARDFLERLLIRKEYDDAFGYFSEKSYSCYNLFRDDSEPGARSSEEAGRYLRAAIEESGKRIGEPKNLEEILAGVEPTHPAVRLMSHTDEATFTLVSLPNITAELFDCERRARGEPVPEAIPPEYGEAFGVYVRLRTGSGEAPVFRTLWAKEGGQWRITAYDIEEP